MNLNTLQQIGEQGVLDIILETAREVGAKLHPDLGFDDTAVIDRDEFDSQTVWTSDALVENTHFKFYPCLEKVPVEWLGRKLFRTNLSDLSSKGALPRVAVLSVGFPGHAPVGHIKEFFQGLLSEMASHDVMLAGGDTHKSEYWCLQLTLVGDLTSDMIPPKRPNIKVGQNVFVTGNPGMSGLGFEMLQTDSNVYSDYQHLPKPIESHLVPPDRSIVGRALVQNLHGLAMMDCSDGIVTDCRRLCRIGKVGIELELHSKQIQQDASLSKNFMGYFLQGGEDYELLFCANASLEEVSKLITSVDHDCNVQQIGKVVSGNELNVSIDGTEHRIDDDNSYEHFPKSESP